MRLIRSSMHDGFFGPTKIDSQAAWWGCCGGSSERGRGSGRACPDGIALMEQCSTRSNIYKRSFQDFSNSNGHGYCRTCSLQDDWNHLRRVEMFGSVTNVISDFAGLTYIDLSIFLTSGKSRRAGCCRNGGYRCLLQWFKSNKIHELFVELRSWFSSCLCIININPLLNIKFGLQFNVTIEN